MLRQGTDGYYGQEIEGEKKAARKAGEPEQPRPSMGHRQDRQRDDAELETTPLATE
jgi:hypothetical protein